ncbi:MAG TPA: zf-HC2 domain-containing protein, partial [Gemmataceae bacterium]|nr:zf-HC2 domain-containing protein [Gemmataceae bacterium]
MSRCPTPQHLEQFLDESLDPATQEATSSHVAGCPRCQSALEALTTAVPLLDSVLLQAGPTSRPPVETPPEMMAFLESLKAAAPQPAGAANGTATQAPPPIPGYEILGKLGRGGMGV